MTGTLLVVGNILWVVTYAITAGSGSYYSLVKYSKYMIIAYLVQLIAYSCSYLTLLVYLHWLIILEPGKF